MACKELVRRTFLKQTFKYSAAAMILPRHVLGGKGFVAPSEKVNIAIIGTGGQGIVNIKNLFKEDDAQIVAIADPNLESDYSRFYYGGTAGRGPALKLLHENQEESGTEIRSQEYSDYRVLLDREKNIDAVLVATPDHAHAVTAMAAIQLGKHVYCEKPLTHSVYEARTLASAAKEAGVATQMGNQGHSGDGIRETCEMIWDGAVGTIQEIHAWSSVGGWASGNRPTEQMPIPDGFDWDIWLGPAKFRPYHIAYAPYNWRGWWDFGTGAVGDMACHNIDPAVWALKLNHPVSIAAKPDKIHPEIVPDKSTIVYEFPARDELPPIRLTWYDGGLLPETPEELGGRSLGGNGILFIGKKGKILCGGWGGAPRLLPDDLRKSYKAPKPSIPRSNGHHRDWLDACKGGKEASGSFEYSARLTELVLLANIAQRIDEKLEWNGPEMNFTNLNEANQYLNPPYRKGWSL
jgi:predicted dehydrogenase